MRIALGLVVLALVACGGTDAPTGAQIAISASGFSPANITLPSGGSVTFTNNDTASHQIQSSCSDMTSGTLTKGQTFTATLAGPKTCNYSDGLNPTNTAFAGTVSVSSPASGGGGGGGGSGY
ncbi:MAG: cupredoxin domain-containing protein [Deltaproteobacteria bacterium]|nr:cupredoxin domain-containing protein [Deltaproteobacteria bacterium]